jgi:hypothetical protein
MALRIPALLPLAIALSSGCTELPRSLEGEAVPAKAEESGPDTGWGGDAKLYARDGSVVDASGQDRAREESTAAPRELAPSEGGRLYILELYQKAIDQRDSLEKEARALQTELERVKQTLVGSETDAEGLQARVAQLTADNKRLLDENVDLAARLATAQIRRLQVEKILLESRIDAIKAVPLRDPSPAQDEQK